MVRSMKRKICNNFYNKKTYIQNIEKISYDSTGNNEPEMAIPLLLASNTG